MQTLKSLLLFLIISTALLKVFYAMQRVLKKKQTVNEKSSFLKQWKFFSNLMTIENNLNIMFLLLFRYAIAINGDK